MKKIEDITNATTIDKSFYTDVEIYKVCIDKLFCKSWLYIADAIYIQRSQANIFPVRLLDKGVDEPLIIIDEGESMRCMTNVCTHRAFQIVHHPIKSKKITCAYHGRRYDLEGKVEHMPMFDEVKDFPRPCDHLHNLDLHRWKRFLFTGIDPQIDFDIIKSKLDERLSFMDMDNWRHAPEFSKSYTIKAHWALYVDNYLEGFHIPFVHNSLTNILDFGNYTTEIYNHMVLQIGYGKPGDPAIDLPVGHPDEGKIVTAYYYWIFPNFMLNIYNWGVQINVVKPMGVDYCKVDFEYYIADEELWEQFGKDSIAEKTEREDEYVVEAVQSGLRSRFYKNGQYSPKMETGVHYFHQLVKSYLGGIASTS